MLEMAFNNSQWSNERSSIKKVAEMHEVDPLVSLAAQVSALTSQISALTTREASSSQESVMVANASYVGDGSD